MHAQPLYQSHIAGDAEQSRDQNAASIPRIDRRPWVVRVRTACRGTDLPLGARAVGMCIASYFDFAGTWAVSRETLAAELDINERTLTRYLQRLKAANIIEVHAGGSDGRSWSRYQTGSAISKMAPARRTEPATGGADTPRQGGRPDPPIESYSGSGSGSSRSSALHSSGGTQTDGKPRHDPRDDDRIVCPTCGASWPRRFGSQCFSCSGLSPDVPGNRPVVTKRGKDTDIRHTCLTCGNSWPTKYGTKCKKCGLEHDPKFKPLTAEQLAAVKKRQAASMGVVCRRCCGVYDASVPGAGILGKCPNCRDITNAEAAKLRKVKGDEQRKAYWAARLPLAGDAPRTGPWHAERAQATADAILSARVKANTVGEYHHGC